MSKKKVKQGKESKQKNKSSPPQITRINIKQHFRTREPARINNRKMTMKKKEKSICNDLYREHTCTTAYYRLIGSCLVTDGAKHVGEEQGCWWFYDIIISAIATNERICREPFQVWYLERIDGSHFRVLCTDGNYSQDATREANEKSILFTQDVVCHDFRFDLFKVFVSRRIHETVIYLPSEH